MKAVITGATSMIGAATARSLLDAGHEVWAVVRSGTGKMNRLPQSSDLHTVACDISEYDKLPQLISETCDVFYHFAWQATGGPEVRNSLIYQQASNVPLTVVAVDAAELLGCKKFVGAGSQAEFGLHDIDCISPCAPCDPIQPYGAAKFAAGKLAMAEAAARGIDCAWVRIFSVYGPNDRPGSLIGFVTRKLLAGERPALTPAQQRWDFLYESDAGDALRAIGESDAGSKVYCLGSGQARSIQSYVEDIRDIIDPSLELGIGEVSYPPNCVMNLCADISELQADTGWAPKVGFAEGAGCTVAYIREREFD